MQHAVSIDSSSDGCTHGKRPCVLLFSSTAHGRVDGAGTRQYLCWRNAVTRSLPRICLVTVETEPRCRWFRFRRTSTASAELWRRFKNTAYSAGYNTPHDVARRKLCDLGSKC